MTNDEMFRALVTHPYAAEIAGRLFEAGNKMPASSAYGDELVGLYVDIHDQLQIARARARGRS